MKNQKRSGNGALIFLSVMILCGLIAIILGFCTDWYRDWTRSNRRGTFFAKLQRVDRARGVAYLRQVGGRVLRMRLKSMTAEDAAYVESRSPSSGSKKN